MKRSALLLSVLAAVFLLAACRQPPPAKLGFPGALDYSYLDTTIDGQVPISVFYPKGPAPEGGYPLVIFSVGWNQTRAAYQGYGIQLAQWGYVAVLRSYPLLFVDGIGYDNNEQQIEQISAIIDWAAAQNEMPDSPLFGLVDTTRVGSTGHSLGGRQAVVSAARDPRIQAVIDIDSVEESSLLPMQYCVPDIHAPILWMRGEVLCATLGNRILDSLYRIANPPTADVIIRGAGHLDFIESFQGMNRVAPIFCGPNERDPNEVRAIAVSFMVAWFNVYLKNDLQWASYFEGPDAEQMISENKASIEVRWK